MHLYVTTQNTKLRKVSRRLILVDKNDNEIISNQLLHIESVSLFGNVQITNQCIRALCSDSIPLAVFSQKGQLLFRVTPPASENITLRIQQIDKARDKQWDLKMSRHTVLFKLLNEASVSGRICRRNHQTNDPVFISILSMIKRLNPENLDSLRGYEGAAAVKYFSILRKYYSGNLPFGIRTRRPPLDPVNAAMSFSYGIIYNIISGIFQALGLDPQVSYFHRIENGRHSLSLDIMEPYRPIIDRLILSLFNRHLFRKEHFESLENGGTWLSAEGRNILINHFFIYATKEQKWEKDKNLYSLLDMLWKSCESMKSAIHHDHLPFFRKIAS